MIKLQLIRLWFWILSKVKQIIDDKIELSEEPHVVYFNMIYPEVYICPDGASAQDLVKLYDILNKKLGRSCVTILYGRVDLVFKYKIPKLMDMIFIWDASKDERDKVFNLIIETPQKIR